MTIPRLGNLFGLVILILGAVALLAFLPVQQRTIYTCVRCRAERTEHAFLFVIPWHTEEATEFTSWYSSHFPAHTHNWHLASCTRGRDLFGKTVFWACGRRHPICDLAPRDEREFLAAADPAMVASFFRGLESPDREVQQETVESASNRVVFR
jgi:hypothetical protein